jgi:hypothetical protein
VLEITLDTKVFRYPLVEVERNLDRVIHQSAGHRATTDKKRMEPDSASTAKIVTGPLDAQDQDVEINDQESADGSSQTDLAHEESINIGRELKMSENVRTVEQFEGSATAVLMQESEIIPISIIETDNDDERARSEVTGTKKATRSGTQYFVSTSFFSETQGLMLHVEHGQLKRPEHTFRWHHPFASTDEKLEAYAKEKQTWISNQAMECISKSNVPQGGNVLKSSVIYEWMNQETLKARIVRVAQSCP